MLDSHVKGIPCKIDVTMFHRVKPWRGDPHNCPSDWDYYGYTEIEFEVYDRKGYRAGWLENKLDDVEIERIENEIIEYMENQE